jgi:hypothetical protein
MKNSPIQNTNSTIGDPKMLPWSDPKMLFAFALLLTFVFLAGFFIGKRVPIVPQPKPDPVIQIVK